MQKVLDFMKREFNFSFGFNMGLLFSLVFFSLLKYLGI